jgi:cyanophycin synthetase
MKLAEIRDLDGPNLFMLEPAIKVELVIEQGESRKDLITRLGGGADLTAAAARAVGWLHKEANQPPPRVVTRVMDDLDHISIAFGWGRRAFALRLGQALLALAAGEDLPRNLSAYLQSALESDSAEDRPILVRDSDRTAIAISVTGTNGKTTTTRLIAHLMRTAGYRTGWNSSSGIYIEGELVEDGDYSGPTGAQRILGDPSLGAAVLETARGGILLRGLGYEHNDVSVFTNVSADHLDLHGVRTLKTLAEVKSVVCRVTRPDGVCVLNADDELVMSATKDAVARRVLVSRLADNPVVADHLDHGGVAIIGTPSAIEVRGQESGDITYEYSDLPVTHSGRATPMVENAMCAIGAALGAGLIPEQIRQGMKSFENDPAHNPGRMNIYSCDGVTVVLDFAHNEVGLKHLIEFGRGDVRDGGRLISIIGTAGDRNEASLRAIGRIAAEHSDIVIAKGTEKYLRGRTLEDLMGIYSSGAKESPERDYHETRDELSALELALEIGRPGDVVVMMVHEQVPQLVSLLQARSS